MEIPKLNRTPGRGRKSKRTPEREAIILDAISAGNTHECAAALAGISASTLYSWAGGFPEFSEALRAREAEAEREMVAALRTGAKVSWQAALRWLQRRRPATWGELAPPPAPTVTEDLAALEARLRAATRPPPA